MSTVTRQEQDSAAAAAHPKQSERIMNAKIEQEEVQSSLQRASKNTAPGTDEAYNELLTQGGEYMQKILHFLFNVVWAEEQLPNKVQKNGTARSYAHDTNPKPRIHC